MIIIFLINMHCTEISSWIINSHLVCKEHVNTTLCFPFQALQLALLPTLLPGFSITLLKGDVILMVGQKNWGLD